MCYVWVIISAVTNIVQDITTLNLELIRLSKEVEEMRNDRELHKLSLRNFQKSYSWLESRRDDLQVQRNCVMITAEQLAEKIAENEELAGRIVAIREKRRCELAGLRAALSQEADRVISDLQNKLKDYECERTEWEARVESLWWQIGALEQGGSTRGVSPPSHYSSHEELIVENPSTAIVPYIPPLSTSGTSGSQTFNRASAIGDSDGSDESDLIGDFE
ncbi:hypothetical protein Dimus_033452 [Dionaea muscipula]